MPKDFREYREEISRLIKPEGIGEAAVVFEAAPAAKLDERLAQCIWFDSLFVHGGLKADSGEPLEIVQAGRWNEEEGPDFKDAKLRIGGISFTGDVEIHLFSSGWRQHRHQLDRRYDSVILHAYLWSDGKPAAQCRNSKGDAVFAFAMHPVLFPDLETIRETLHLEDYPYRTPAAWGKCQSLMCSLEYDYVANLLVAAGRERMESKIRRYREQAIGELLDQVLYQALLTSMGLKSSKSLFFLLSKRTPVSEIIDYLRDVPEEKATLFFQSILLHVAGLVPAQLDFGDDAEREAYVAELRRIWSQFLGFYSDRLIPPTKRWTTGVRPVNFAHRRLAGIAHLLSRHFASGDAIGCFAKKIPQFNPSDSPPARRRWIQHELVNALIVDDPLDFWSCRYTFNSEKTAAQMKLIGANRAMSIAFNALLPLILLYARNHADAELEQKAWAVFESFPPLESNSIVRHMQVRLFGDDPRGLHILDKEARQQGLFHIFAECCNMNDTGCEDCYYLQPHG